MVFSLLAVAASAASLASPQIAYNDLGGNVYISSPSGAGAAQLYSNTDGTNLTALSLSSDGRTVLALSSGDTQQLVLLQTSGGPPAPVTGTADADAGALSADGKQVVFSMGGDAAGIYTVAA